MKVFELQQFERTSLVLAEREEPRPGPREVLLRIKAVALNFRDALLLRGVLRPDQPLPLIPGSDAVGEIIERGTEVTRFQIGDRVAGNFVQAWVEGDFRTEMMHSTLGTPRTGMLQEYVVLPEEGIVHVPAHLTDEQAATLPIAGVTAWHALIVRGKIKPGETVLVQGTGGVALFALQFAQLAGAQVIVTSRSEEKGEAVRRLGAALVINTHAISAWDEPVRGFTSGRGVDHVVDLGGAATLARSLQTVRSGGQISVIGVLGGMQTEIDLALMQNKQVCLQGIQTGSRRMFEEMNVAIANHHMFPVVGQSYSFEETPDAVQALLQGNTFGKICIRF